MQVTVVVEFCRSTTTPFMKNAKCSIGVDATETETDFPTFFCAIPPVLESAVSTNLLCRAYSAAVHIKYTVFHIDTLTYVLKLLRNEYVFKLIQW